MDKKIWQKPELIILARSMPEEAVLTTCKGGGKTVDSSSRNNGCYNKLGGGCGTVCNAVVTS